MTERRRELENLRRQLAEGDAEILRVLLRRAKLARQIGELAQGSAASAVGEHELLRSLEQMAADELPPEVVTDVFRAIHAATAPLERPARVAFVLPEGGFCQLAAQQRFGLGANFMAVESPELAIEEVRRRRADLAVFAFESSLEGPLQASVEALSATEMSLSAKIELAAVRSVMSKAGNLAEIQKLYCYGPDRLACQRYVASLENVAIVDVRSPWVACQMCLEDPTGAAIVPQAAGERAGLGVLQTNVSDRADLRIRYAVASARPSHRSGADTTAIIFGVHDQPGALFDVLRHFAERGINLKTLQSRPANGDSWNYVFYVEVSGHVTDRALVTALEEIKRQTRLLKVLGSFPSC
ncbi:MAG TPA: prephenate dehydratase domain-containing protein [Polyangiaceae bacterium]